MGLRVRQVGLGVGQEDKGGDAEKGMEGVEDRSRMDGGIDADNHLTVDPDRPPALAVLPDGLPAGLEDVVAGDGEAFLFEEGREEVVGAAGWRGKKKGYLANRPAVRECIHVLLLKHELGVVCKICS